MKSSSPTNFSQLSSQNSQKELRIHYLLANCDLHLLSILFLMVANDKLNPSTLCKISRHRGNSYPSHLYPLYLLPPACPFVSSFLYAKPIEGLPVIFPWPGFTNSIRHYSFPSYNNPVCHYGFCFVPYSAMWKHQV